MAKIAIFFRSRIDNCFCLETIFLLEMSEKGVFGVQERFLGYSKPELLQIASYLAQHDVAFNNIPEYSTEGPGGQSVDDHKVESYFFRSSPFLFTSQN